MTDAPVIAGVPMRPFWPIVAATAVLAIVMILSPVTLVSGAILCGITAAACRGLTGLERRIVLFTMVSAIAIRVAIIGGLFLTADPSHIISFSYDGDGLWEKLRSLWIRNHWLGIPVHPRQLEDAITLYGWSSYIYVMAYTQYLLGPSPYAVHLLSVCCFVGAAALLYRMIRRPFGPVAGVVALIAILYTPTLLMWSVAAMRESFYLLSLTIFVVGLVLAGRSPRLMGRLAGLLLAGCSLWLADTIRVGAVVILAASGALAIAGSFVTRRAYLLLIALLVVPPLGWYASQRTGVQARVLAQLRQAAITHRGNVNEEGHGYKILDQRIYQIEPMVEGIQSMTWPEAERYVARSLVAVALMPYPWQAASRTEVLFIPQQVIWYVIVCLAIIGTVRGLRTEPFPTWALLALSVVTCVLMAPNEGNIGTMVRHRDTILPFIICLAALGAISVLSWTGAWSYAKSWVPREPNGPTLLRRTLDGSVVARAVEGSVLYRVIRAFFRGAIGYHDDAYGFDQRRAIEELVPWILASRVGRVVERVTAGARRAWSASGVATYARGLAADVRTLDVWQRFRLAGMILLAALLLAVVPGFLLGQMWPTAIVWTGAVACALAAIVSARPIARAWNGRATEASGPFGVEVPA